MLLIDAPCVARLWGFAAHMDHAVGEKLAWLVEELQYTTRTMDDKVAALQKEVEDLKAQLADIQEALLYAPGGAAYQQARADFKAQASGQ